LSNIVAKLPERPKVAFSTETNLESVEDVYELNEPVSKNPNSLI
jgi:hypothetical protein